MKRRDFLTCAGATLCQAAVPRLAAADTPADMTLRIAPVALEIAGTSEAYALVLEVDDQGQVSQVWPSDGAQSARLPAQGRLSPGFTAASGDSTVWALLSEEPLPAAGIIEALALETRSCLARGAGYDCAAPAQLPEERNRAKLRLAVAP